MDEKLLRMCDICTGRLIIGNHDSLVVYGSDVQAKLREFSKTLSRILTQSNDELEVSINDVLQHMEKFQNQNAGTIWGRIGLTGKGRSGTVKKYNELLTYLDKMTVCLQMQQAQLLKDTNILEQMEPELKECSDSLEMFLKEGRGVLEKSAELAAHTDDEFNRRDLEDWGKRLGRKLESLQISHTMTLQSIAQLRLMKDNNRQIVDRIISTVSGTIPIWRNQITILLGLERTNRDLEVQRKVAQIANNHVSQNANAIRKIRKKEHDIDVDALKQANDNLSDELNQLKSAEQIGKNIRLELNKSLV